MASFLVRPLALVLVAGAPFLAAPAHAQSGTFGTDQNSCDRTALQSILSTSKGNIIGSLGGAAIGGLVGNQFGGGSGKGIMTAVGVIGGALAGGYVGRSMDPADHACVDRTLEHTPTGQTVSWQNPDNGTRYQVTPTSTYSGGNGLPCRNYTTQAMIDGQPQQVEGTACRQADGTWRTNSPPGATRGADGDTVFKVQQRLRDLGFYVRDNIDGKWGPKTSTALRNFQRSKGLDASGQIDQPTLAALDLQTNAPAPTAQAAPPAAAPLAPAR